MENVLFTDKDLRNLHKQCMVRLIDKCNAMEEGTIQHASLLSSIKNMFFDKDYYKRGFSYNPQTKKYKWVF